MWETLNRPEPPTAAHYHSEGWWRRGTFLDDLARTVQDAPERPAIIAYSGGKVVQELTYRELSGCVDRFAGALRELGVGSGDVVMAYLPNWWMLTPLFLACTRLDAVIFPFHPAYAGRELAKALRISGAKVCVTADTYEGTDMAARLAEAVPDESVHRVVVGGDAARTGAIDFEEFFVRTAWEERVDLSGIAPRDPDEVGLLLFTSGTTGEPKCIAHTGNTLYAAVRTVSVPFDVRTGSVISIPHFLTHMAGGTYGVYMSVATGSTCVMQDDTDMELLLDIIAEHQVTFAYASPLYVTHLLAAQRGRQRDLSSLRHLVSGSAPIPSKLISEAQEVLGVEMYALWGMTENGGVTVTRPGDPIGWAAESDGSTEPWMEVRVAVDAEYAGSGGPAFGRLLTRGASQCLGYVNLPEVYAACVDEDGWFDTGDTAREDGRGGIRITGRRDDLITRATGAKVPTLEVEALLVRHPSVAEVVLIGYPDPTMEGAEEVCAMVVAGPGEPPTLEQLREALDAEKVTWENWPDRLELVAALPKNSLGKVQRTDLRKQLLDLVAAD
jgi:cyclohexanecarboxylate-CoA ligase